MGVEDFQQLAARRGRLRRSKAMNSRADIQMTCPNCSGLGKVWVGGKVHGVLQALKRLDKDESITAAEIAAQLGLGRSATCNYLRLLEQLGHAKRVRGERNHRWTKT